MVPLGLLIFFGLISVACGRGGGAMGNGLYIVELRDLPVVAYTGGMPRLEATAPRAGEKLDPYSLKVTKYVNYLTGAHDTTLRTVVPGAQKVYSYTYAFNGFAAKLTNAQAAELRQSAAVKNVVLDVTRKVATFSTPDFLGLTEKDGLWAQLLNTGGDGIVIGMIDTGIWPESPSFSDEVDGTGGQSELRRLPGWHGRCIPGEAFPASACNQKLIGARWYNAGRGGDTAIKSRYPWEYLSARDSTGHGTHISSIAAGNQANGTANGTYFGQVSGMAPWARIAAYKSCWGSACTTSDVMAALDQAVADGVDIINVPIHGTATDLLDPIEIAFLHATQAGIFVAAAAGNSGPVNHPSPWVTTVAAGSHDRGFPANVTLDNGCKITLNSSNSTCPFITMAGWSSSSVGTSRLQVILAANASRQNATELNASFCLENSLDPSVVANAIVVCNSGVNLPSEKSQEVLRAGGKGVILTDVGTFVAPRLDVHFVPTVHVDQFTGAAIKRYVNSTPGAMAQLSPGRMIIGVDAPAVASFSSRGPPLACADLLKPDIMAPGQDVFAAYSPAAANLGLDFAFLTGTSVATAHISGVAALLGHLNPDWSPAAMRSAMMTTATTITNQGRPILSDDDFEFAYGAGNINPNNASDPGLVYNSNYTDYMQFLCGLGLVPPPCNSIPARNLNEPAITLTSFPGHRLVTRRVTNVGLTSSNYSLGLVAPPGITVTVTPAAFRIAPGKTQEFSVNLTVKSGVRWNEFVRGAIQWSDGLGHVVTSPIVLYPVAIQAPAVVEVDEVPGPISFGVVLGYTGLYSLKSLGLHPPITYEDVVLDDPLHAFDPNSSGVASFNLSVPNRTAAIRFAFFAEDMDGMYNDVDLHVYFNGAEIQASIGPNATEQVTLYHPVPGTYTAYIHGWSIETSNCTVKLFAWVIPSEPVDPIALVVSTTSTEARMEGQANVTAQWGYLPSDDGTRYLGAVQHITPGLPVLTLISIKVSDGSADPAAGSGVGSLKPKQADFPSPLQMKDWSWIVLAVVLTFAAVVICAIAWWYYGPIWWYLGSERDEGPNDFFATQPPKKLSLPQVETVSTPRPCQVVTPNVNYKPESLEAEGHGIFAGPLPCVTPYAAGGEVYVFHETSMANGQLLPAWDHSDNMTMP